MKTSVYNWKGEQVSETNIPEAIFMRPWNPDLVHEVILAQAANRRKPVAHAKGRGEVSGGGKKPWRQKGTGRARHGSIRSPIWKGGGVTHGPISEKNFSKKVNKKAKSAAIYSALSKKLAVGELKVLNTLKIEEEKTKALNSALHGFFNIAKSTKKLSVLLIPQKGERAIFKTASNIPTVKASAVNSINIEDVLRYKNVLIDEAAISEFTKKGERAPVKAETVEEKPKAEAKKTSVKKAPAKKSVKKEK
ncbi:MAG: 50S ribosomal protein L4 [Candidatus Harrisonbacteria bacterium CG10_big_fil_rev_8_21_14_0_10_40_38]|uniref:Large ribosomal subunit protein uL4 n=1 Tax=Candidatus Harrisonbacteria bacterium CG10_big_fil_rev_8_21_14_0_10_40_38 TaxID=1974583 RepID=A0A2H0USE7_9BACT|nr:MAG: 50S ribosomal protein L4 [Candidatus Harrisonbacteria bacterium CG10_big_fil_rev_8_21_14_0_10_40_38]